MKNVKAFCLAVQKVNEAQAAVNEAQAAVRAAQVLLNEAKAAYDKVNEYETKEA